MDACDESSADESQSFVQSSDEDSEAVTERQNSTESRSFDGIQKHSVPTQQFRVRTTSQSLAPEDSAPCYLPETQLSKESPGSGSPKCKSKGTAKDMSERERGLRNRNPKVERACFNAAAGSSSQSRNHLHQHHRHESEARNRPREKSQNSNRNHCALNFERRSDFMTVTGAATAANSANEKMAVDSSAMCEEDEEEDSSQKNESSSDSKVISSFPPIPVVHNWQATKSNVKERLGFMFCNELMADVFFIVGKNSPRQRIPAHRFVLSIGSAVFDAMFNGGMATDEKEIELPDIEPAAFLCLLKFFYSDEVRIGPDTVMASLYAAKKYAVPALELGCVDYLKKHLSSDNAFMLLMQARLFDEPHLATMCLEMIDKTTSEALVADGFTDIDLDTLCIVLERDTLGIKECKLFAAVARWAEAECNRQGVPATPENHRLVLGRALHLIRFPLMTVEEFAVGAAQSGILTDREALELFLYFTVNPKPHVNFSGVLRCCLTGKEQVVSRFCEIENRWGYSGTSDRIRFVVNRKIFIVGFGLYGSIQSPAEYAVNIQILHTDTGHVCGVNDASFLSDGSTSTFRVMFKEPVEIQPNTSYTASATLKGPDSYYGAKGLRKVTHESITSGKVIFQFTYAAGNNNGTSVEDGQIPEIVFYTSDLVG